MLDSRALRALLSLGLVVGVGATGTYAYWTDQAVITGTTIQAGTIDLKASTNGGTTYADNPTDFTTMNVSTMVPGDTTAGIITIKNNGTAPLTYSATSFGSNGDSKSLATALAVKVTLDTSTTGTGRAVTCAGTQLAGSGTTIGLTATNLMSSASPRTLAAGASEKICIQVGLPAAADTALQGATTNLTFTFNGTSF
jgi:predicted ribosomally synthesized peptide with SipW-like signal peptide